jgi:hypothetical protein
MTTSISQSNASDFLVPPDSTIDGKTYSQWAIEYWKEYIDKQTRFNLDPCKEPLLTGDCFIVGKRNSVVFLPSLFSPHNSSYNCTFDTTNYFFFPLYSEECDYSHLTSDAQLQQSVNENNDYATGNLSVDGHVLTNLSRYRLTTDFFNITYVNLNPFNAHPGTYRALINGLFVFIKPLEEGQHVIEYSVTQNPQSFNNHYSSSIVFNMTII